MTSRLGGTRWAALVISIVAISGCVAAGEPPTTTTTTSTTSPGTSTTTPSTTEVPETTTSTSTPATTSTTTTPVGQRGDRVAVPKVTGPVTGGKGLPVTPLPTEIKQQYGYVENEFFIEGTATSYKKSGNLTEDGKWTVTPSTTAPYKTRILTRRPADPAAFNGTVVVEWLNVSAGHDSDLQFAPSYPELLREGYAWVGVSAQKAGVEPGSGSVSSEEPAPLKTLDPSRYGSLAHPGDDFSYDIFSQAAQAIRRPDGPDPLNGLPLKTLVAAGESQSAFRLVTYVDAVHPRASIFDGFMIHSRSAGAAPLAGADSGPGKVLIRTDSTDPVMQVQTETDVVGTLAFAGSRQPDSAKLVTWEIAGSGHADQSMLEYSDQQSTTYGGARFSGADGCGAINDGQAKPVLNAAWSALNRWLNGGQVAPSAPRIQTTTDGKAVRDNLGIAQGGIRTPAVDAPISVESGLPHAGHEFDLDCILFGSSTPLSAAQLAQLYPTHADYVSKVQASLEPAVAAGYVLDEEADAVLVEAQAAPVPR
jgi:hypothetical protein